MVSNSQHDLSLKLRAETLKSEYDTLKNKYNEQCKRIDDEIRKVLASDSIELSQEESEKYQISDDDDIEELKGHEGHNGDDDNNINHYWYSVFINANFFTFNSFDKRVLFYMSNITINDIDNDSFSFEVVFHFHPNEYFTHEAIRKKYYYDKEKIAFYRTEGFYIQWSSDDINPTLRKKRIRKGKGKKRISYAAQDSFFNIFKPSMINSHTLIIEDEAYFFKHDLFNHQLEYYLNIKNRLMIDDSNIRQHQNEDNQKEKGQPSE